METCKSIFFFYKMHTDQRLFFLMNSDDMERNELSQKAQSQSKDLTYLEHKLEEMNAQDDAAHEEFLRELEADANNTYEAGLARTRQEAKQSL